MSGDDLRSLWEQRLAEQQISGQSIAAWCKEQSIKDNQFYYWRKKLSRDQVDTLQPVKWVPLQLSPGNITPESIAVHIGLATVEIKKGFDQQLLREIVQILQTV